MAKIKKARIFLPVRIYDGIIIGGYRRKLTNGHIFPYFLDVCIAVIKLSSPSKTSFGQGFTLLAVCACPVGPSPVRNFAGVGFVLWPDDLQSGQAGFPANGTRSPVATQLRRPTLLKPSQEVHNLFSEWL